MPDPLYLNIENIDSLPINVSTPNVDRNKIKTSIAHIGVSNFHRAHQAHYIHELIEKHQELNFGICGIDLLDTDRKIYNVLKDQDGLYSLIIKNANGIHTIKVISSIVEYFFAPENPMAVIERLASPDIEIISLTIAEDGYHLNEITGEFDLTHPTITEDLKNVFFPKTVFGYITQAFKLRKYRGIPGCTLLSCDNIKDNGNTMKQSFFSYISKTEPELISWFEKNVTFPNTMVDRITPVTQTEDIETLKKDYFLYDQWPVVCEPFSNWIIEDNFFYKKPHWEKVGVQFVENIEPYENMKLQLLNAGHTILGILGTLHGYKMVHEAANDVDFMFFLKTYMDEEVLPTLINAETISVEDYKNTLVSRFENPYIQDNLSRICRESSVKVPIFILPTIHKQLLQKRTINRAAFFIATWCKYNDGVDDHGNFYNINDSLSNTLIRMAALSQQNPIRFLEINSIFKDLNTNPIFVDQYLKYLEHIKSSTIKDCIRKFNKGLF